MSSANKISILLIVLLCTACSAPASEADSADSLRALALKVAEAHGGVDRWNDLRSLSIGRRHHMFRDAEPFHFRIVGEYPTRRIYQDWEQPGGEVVWDGEQAWSNDWGFKGRFSERFTAAIGFYLANMPWYILDSEARLLSAESRPGIIPGSDKTYTVLEVEFEADPVRKPRGYQGIRDSFGIVIDVETYRIAGVIERRTYAGQLDMSGAAPEQTHFEDIFVIESTVSEGGLIWPGEYSLYTLSGTKYGEGIFHDYAVNVEFKDAWMQPANDAVTSSFDRTSSYRRLPAEG